ncbi:MAG: hypothetical protein M1824_004658 [Vezdaea acicularis]|nr:MAG: hypothetical protein M1824_004658 [Vezdaea acicularis]
MKILTKEEQDAHYNATVRGGLLGGALGLGAGVGAVYLAHLRSSNFRALTLPLKAFLATSAGTFAAIIQADRSSRNFEIERHPEEKLYKDQSMSAQEQIHQQQTGFQRAKDWGRENRYGIVGASWVASMGVALALVGRNPYLTKAQKLVQARVYAQGLTVAVLMASAAFELGDANKGAGRWETVKILDPDDPEHKHMIEKRIHHERYAGEDMWRDMVDAEEKRIEERKKAVKEQEAKDAKAKGKKGNKGGKDEQEEKGGEENGKDSEEGEKLKDRESQRDNTKETQHPRKIKKPAS